MSLREILAILVGGKKPVPVPIPVRKQNMKP